MIILLLLLLATTTHAATIIDTSTVTKTLPRVYLFEDCEWIDAVETTTFITYRDELTYVTTGTSYLTIMPSHNDPKIVTLCDDETIPDEQKPHWCFYQPVMLGSSSLVYAPSLRTWKEKIVDIDYLHVDTCNEECHPSTPVPEPSPLALALTGIALICGKKWLRG